MGNDRYYKPGDFYRIDDLAGIKIRASRSRKIPAGQTGGLIVDISRWEPQQSQDLVRGIVDDQTVPEPRPRQPNQFIILATEVAAPAARGASSITVGTTVGWEVGMLAQVMLDSGDSYRPRILAIPDGETFTLSIPLPYSVGTLYGDPIENQVLSLGATGSMVFLLGVPGSDILGFNTLG